MTPSVKTTVRALTWLAVIVLPLAALAADSSGSTSSGLSGGAAVALTTPLGGVKLETFIGQVVKTILGLTGVIALVMFVWGGFLWMTAGGNTDRVKKAKGTVIWASIGLIVIFASYSIVQFVIQTLEKS